MIHASINGNLFYVAEKMVEMQTKMTEVEHQLVQNKNGNLNYVYITVTIQCHH